MELTKGQVAVVTGGASGIGLALAERFAGAGLDLVIADVQDDALAAGRRAAAGPSASPCCRSASTSARRPRCKASPSSTDRPLRRRPRRVQQRRRGRARPIPWFGPLSSWEWVMGVNFWGVVHGCRAFLPHLAAGGGHIVNTASIAGLYPGFAPSYDASKHSVVAIQRAPLQHGQGRRPADRRQRAVPGLGAHQHRSTPSATGRPSSATSPTRTRPMPSRSAILRTGARRGPHPGIGRRRRARRRGRRPLLGHPAPGLPRPVHRALGDDRRARRPAATGGLAGHAAALADPRRGRRRPRPRRPRRRSPTSP